jgi:undecaprenyl-diphosphatase
LTTLQKFVKYLLLGLVQGITEPLPISSSGHVIVFDHLLGINIIDINFEIIINFASFLAIIWFFRKDIGTLLSNIIKNKRDEELNITYVFKLVVASLPAVIMGLLFKDYIDAKFMSLLTVGISFIFTGLLLAYANTFKNRFSDPKITYKNSLFIGLMQMVALIPGISRSGATLSGGLMSKKDTRSVLRFSFFMYMIVSLGSMVLMVRDLDGENIFLSGYIGAFIVSMISCYMALKWFYNLILQKSLKGFAIYCLLLGMVIVILSL